MPVISDPIPDPSLARPSFSAEAAGLVPEAYARLAETVGTTADDIRIKATNLRREQQSTSILLDKLPQMQEIAQKWSMVPDRDQAEQGFLGDSKSVIAQATDGVGDPYVAARVQSELGHSAATMAGGVSDRAFAQQRNAQQATLLQHAQDAGALLAQTTDPVARDAVSASYQRELDAARAAHLIEPTDAVDLAKRFHSSAATVQVDQAAAPILRSHDPLAMSALADKINDPRNFPDLLPEHRAQLVDKYSKMAFSYDQAAIEREKAADDHAEHELRLGQAANEAKVMAWVLGGNAPTPTMGAQLLRSQQITPAGWAAIESATQGRDDPMTAISLHQDLNNGALDPDHVLTAIAAGKLSKATGVELLNGHATQQKQGADAATRGDLGVLKTVVGADAVEKGMIDLDNDAGRQKAQVVAQALNEWNQRVNVGKENSHAVLLDMVPRYQLSDMPPATWPSPKMGMVRSTADVGTVWQGTKDALARGAISQGDYDGQVRLLDQYRQFYQSRDASAAAAKAIKAPGKGAAGPAALSDNGGGP